MTSTVETRVLELLCSRLCHELISPVSAISNGLELMGDDPGDMLGEITALLRHSSSQASQRLKFYRIAYGLGGEAEDSLGLNDAGELVSGIAEEAKVTVSWPDGADALGRVAVKVLLNTALMAIEALPRGGGINAVVSAGSDLDITISATGEGAQLWQESIAALEAGAGVDALTPRSVQAYFTRHLVDAAGGSFSYDTDAGGTVTLKARLPVNRSSP